MKKEIFTPKAPKPLGPYSQAILINNMLFVSGSIGIDEAGNLKPDIVSQTKQCLSNIQHILQEAGFNLEDVVKTTIYLTHLENFAVINAIYEEFFTNAPTKPARSTVEVSSLPKGALIEIDVIAIKA
ncbi:endoribonuclease L-PSP [Hydrogenobaculum sp. Y04AAS1]|uniref:Rid family detoxifying hydrolase n=1 Tax=Hydrogenobaculum sp. (strain Y04AAS1) TaxID=380749 RepID=UPI00015BD2BC|nr:endoribonuclease L-PSP [Hydrogenobaculum sp. Y04AAS1]HCT67217.1 reactive intermediate/imine deaminase [Hydrogenobaculum sp.]